MKKSFLILAVVALAACSGNFSGGGTNPPVPGGQTAPQTPGPVASKGAASDASAGGDTVTLPFSQAATGLQCPTQQGFSCLLKFNVPPSTPTPQPTATAGKGKKSTAKSKGKPKPTATPTPSASPSPTPSPSPSGDVTTGPSPLASGSASPSASASPSGPNITIQLGALPKDAPAMNNPDPKALASTALLSVRIHADADITLDGTAIAAFTLPKEQLGGRSYAIQLFQETAHKKKHDDKFFGSFSQSTIDGSTLTFTFTPPKLPIKKDEVWLFVLYGSETPGASAAPSPGASGSPDAAASPSPSGAPSVAPSSAP